jgi:hypothetical protein
MAVSPDLLQQNYCDFQSKIQPKPNTLASAATIAPSHKFTIVTGTVQVATITAPLDGFHILWFMFTDSSPGALLTSGNILTAYTPIQNRPFAMLYNPNTAKYSPMTVA